MKKTYLYILASLFMLTTFSCDKDEENKFSLELDKSSITIDPKGGEELIKLTANGEWKISGIPEWLSVSPSLGNYTTDIIVVATENKDVTSREASIVFSRESVSKTLIVKQLGSDPFLDLSKSEITIDLAGGEQKIELTTNMVWTVTDVADWVTIDPISGNKSAQITIRVGRNDRSEGRQTSFVFANKDGSIKKRLNVHQYGRKDYISSPYLPIFRFKQVSFTGELIHYDIVANSLFINPSIKKKIYLGNLLSHNAQFNTNIPEFKGYTFNPITISTSAAVSGEIVKTYIPSWAGQNDFAKQIIAKKPSQNASFIVDNGTVEFYTYKQLHTIGVAYLGEKLDELVSDFSYIEKEMNSDYGFIFSFKQTLFTLDMDIPDKLIKEEMKDADKAKGVSYVSSVSYGKIGLLIVESYSSKIRSALNKELADKPLSQEETNLIELASVSYVFYDNDNRLRAYIGGLDAVKEYKKAMSDKELTNIYPVEFQLADYTDNSLSDISFSFDVPKK